MASRASASTALVLLALLLSCAAMNSAAPRLEEAAAPKDEEEFPPRTCPCRRQVPVPEHELPPFPEVHLPPFEASAAGGRRSTCRRSPRFPPSPSSTSQSQRLNHEPTHDASVCLLAAIATRDSSAAAAPERLAGPSHSPPPATAKAFGCLLAI